MKFVKKLKRLGKGSKQKEKRPNKKPKDVKDFEDEESDDAEVENCQIEDKEDAQNEIEEDDGDVNGWKKKKKSGGFQSMGLSPLVLKGILRRGYKVPTPIQRKSIPMILEGKDVVAMARTGSGKTAAFLIPLFEKLQVNKIGIGHNAKFPRALILSPTRELATQTMKFFKEIGKFLNLKVVSILGGDSMESQFSDLHGKPDVIIATPGRFMHLCVEMEFKLDGVEYIVFDEADRLFEMGFGEQLNEIIKRLPDNRQTVLFSATMPRLLVDFTKAGLHDPTLIRLDVDTKLSERLTLQYFGCRSDDKLAVLLYLMKNIVDDRDQTMIFVSTKHHVEFLHLLLEESGIPNCYIYSSLDASARKISLGKFRSGVSNVMIVTDIAARGIDIPVLDNVVNFHFPAKPKLFMHRVGRVARAGRSGTAYSIVAPDEIAFMYDLHLFLGKPLRFTDSDLADNNPNAVPVGRLPQDMLNEENSFVKHLLDIKFDLVGLNKVSRNGYVQYLKSRPNASAESNKRAKAIEVSRLPIHPMFKSRLNADPMESLISQMRNYRPNSTIFEIGPKSGSETHKIMKLKRQRDQTVVEKYRSGKIGDPEAIEAEDQPGKRDEENFIHYLPKDHHTESGLSVGTTFDKQVQDSVMDLTGDDSDKLKNQRNMLKWDKKKKKYVSVGKDSHTNAKKIKTESGSWISASYKSNRYKAWKEKSKVEQQTEADENEDEDDNFSSKNFGDYNQKPTFTKKLVMTGKNAAPRGVVEKKTMRFKSEIKRPEQILKNRKEKEKKLAQNSKKKGKGKKGGGKGRLNGGGKSKGSKKGKKF